MQDRVQAVPQDIEPGSSGSSENQKVPHAEPLVVVQQRLQILQLEAVGLLQSDQVRVDFADGLGRARSARGPRVPAVVGDAEADVEGGDAKGHSVGIYRTGAAQV
ncbi:MAG: hypothetical protein LDL55_05495, partial [Armatimonadetes bacterium]|nr:hypothetical protein [Armatimonadota bacterium]